MFISSWRGRQNNNEQFLKRYVPPTFVWPLHIVGEGTTTAYHIITRATLHRRRIGGADGAPQDWYGQKSSIPEKSTTH